LPSPASLLLSSPAPALPTFPSPALCAQLLSGRALAATASIPWPTHKLALAPRIRPTGDLFNTSSKVYTCGGAVSATPASESPSAQRRRRRLRARRRRRLARSAAGGHGHGNHTPRDNILTTDGSASRTGSCGMAAPDRGGGST